MAGLPAGFLAGALTQRMRFRWAFFESIGRRRPIGVRAVRSELGFQPRYRCTEFYDYRLLLHDHCLQRKNQCIFFRVAQATWNHEPSISQSAGATCSPVPTYPVTKNHYKPLLRKVKSQHPFQRDRRAPRFSFGIVRHYNVAQTFPGNDTIHLSEKCRTLSFLRIAQPRRSRMIFEPSRPIISNHPAFFRVPLKFSNCIDPSIQMYAQTNGSRSFTQAYDSAGHLRDLGLWRWPLGLLPQKLCVKPLLWKVAAGQA